MTAARIAQPRKVFPVEEIWTAWTHRIRTDRKTFATRFMAALKKSRQQEAERIIYRYRHCVDGYQCD